MAFEVPASKAHEPDNLYEFTIDGKTYSVPKLAFMPGSVVERIAEAELRGGVHDRAARYLIFGERGTPAGDAARTLNSAQMDALIADYVTASDISPGESSASTDS